MRASTIPEVKGALLDLLRASGELDGVQVEWAHPGPNALAAEAVYFGDAQATERPVVNGNRRRDESYSLDVVVTVEQYGTDPRPVEERAWALVAAVENVVRDNPRPTPEALIAGVAAKRQANFVDTDGRVSEVVVSVNVRARI